MRERVSRKTYLEGYKGGFSGVMRRAATCHYAELERFSPSLPRLPFCHMTYDQGNHTGAFYIEFQIAIEEISRKLGLRWQIQYSCQILGDRREDMGLVGRCARQVEFQRLRLRLI